MSHGNRTRKNEVLIRAVIFDCFGVLAGESWRPYRNKHFGTSGADFEWANKQMTDVSTGKLTPDAFIRNVCQRTGDDEIWFRDLLYRNPANEELFRYIRDELRSRYKIGLLSNVGSDRLRELFSDEQIGLFDQVVLSYQIGVAKPDKEAYLLAARRLGIEPNECVFVDDIQRYCDGAKTVGMVPIRYDDFETFRQQIDTILADYPSTISHG